MWQLKTVLRILLVWLVATSAFAKDNEPQQQISINVTLNSGLEVPVKQFPATGKDLILWIPPEWGLRGPEQKTATKLQSLGITTWIADFHTAYFEPVGRASLENMEISDISALIELATQQSKRVFIQSAGRGAALSLLALRERQIKKGSLDGVGGAILLYPNFNQGAPNPGDDPSFIPITSHSNLPVYIIQPDLAARYWQLEKLRAALAKSGSPVYSQVLKNVSAGFDLRDERNPTEAIATSELPQNIARALKVLSFHEKEVFKAVSTKQAMNGLSAGQLSTGLQPFKGEKNSIPLRLPTLDGKIIDLKDYKNRVVLLNFWTTWCPPCVKELPSLGRLQKRLADKPFNVIGIDVAESRAVIERFLQTVKVDFPVLMDPNGDTVQDWKLLAFPMSFVIDHKGLVRYGLYGALEWDNDEVVSLMQDMIAEITK